MSRADRWPLLFVAAVIFVEFGVPVVFGRSLLPQYVAPSVYPTGLTNPPESGPSGALTIDPVASSQMLPWRRLVGDAIRHGRLPQWNPYSLTGVPLAANMQSAAFFPLQTFQDLTPSFLWSLFYLVRFWVAGVFTYLLLRRVGLDGPPSAAGAICFTLSGAAILYFRLEPAFNSIVALPLAIYGFERLHGERSRKNFVIASTAFACLLVSGQPEITALNALFLVSYSMVRSWRPRAWAVSIRNLTAALAMYTVGAFLAMPFLLAVVEYLSQAGSAERAAFGKIALSPSIMVLQVAPFVLGTVHQPNPQAAALFSWNLIGGYTGIVAVYLAIVGAWSTTRREFRGLFRFASTTAVVVLLKVYGLPPAQWLAELPGLGGFFFTRYTGAIVAMSVAILAAIGAQAWGRIDERPARRTAFFVTAAITIVLFLPVMRLVSLTGGVAIVLASLAAIGVLVFAPERARSDVMMPVLLTVELMVLGSYVLTGLPKATEIFREPAFVSFLRERQSRDFGRTYSLDGFLYGNYAAAFGVYGLNVCEGLIPFNIRTFAQRFLDPGVNPVFLDGASPFRTSGTARDALRAGKKYYDLAGVKYLVTSPRSGAMLEGAPRRVPVNRQNVAVGFAPGNKVRARLSLERDELSGVKVLMATYGRQNRGRLVLRVSGRTGAELARTELAAAAVPDNDYAEFRFPAIRLTQGADVTLEWEYVAGPIGDAVAFWCEPESRTGYELEGAERHTGVLPYIIQQSDDGWRQVYDGDARIWENLSVFPRAFVVSRVRVARSREEALDMLPSIDLRQEAVVTETTKLTASAKATASLAEARFARRRKLHPTDDVGLPGDVGESPSPVARSLSSVSPLVTIKEMTPTRVTVSVSQARRGLLVMTDTYYPGWMATVDGVARAVHETDGAFRGVFLEEGDREVAFEFRSRTIDAGLILSAVALLGCLVPWRRLRGRSHAAAHSRV